MQKLIACSFLSVILCIPNLILGFHSKFHRSQAMRQLSGLANGPGASHDWPTYGGTIDNQRYSALSQINRRNVRVLSVAWAFQVGFSIPATSFECTPIVVNGVMYVTSPLGDVFALRADTGERLWKFDPKVNLDTTTKLCCGVINRGVAVGGGKVYLATLDARLIALDEKTGQPIASFGDSGIVQIAGHKDGYSETSPPIFHQGMLLIGAAGGEYQTRGFFSAYDAETGKLIWRWHTIPAPGESGGSTWPDTGIYKVGGGSVWMPPAVDLQRGLVIFGTGNPNPDFDGKARAGDNLYTCSIVALDVTTGKMRWYFQQVKHDLWDYDQAAPPVLFDVYRNGKRIPAVGAAGKTGWFYILDRATGKSLIPTYEKEVPQNPAQATARTQTFLTTPPFSEHSNIFGVLDTQGALMAPGINGGSEWSPLSYSPRTGLAYIMAVEQPMLFITDSARKVPFEMTLGGDTLSPPKQMPTGAFVAVDVNTGLVRWRVATTPFPEGGTLATAGDILFAGQSDGLFIALDAETGKRLWQFQCGAGVNAPPVTYEVNGRQYVAVAAGGNSKERDLTGLAGERFFQNGGTIFVFTLPGLKSR